MSEGKPAREREGLSLARWGLVSRLMSADAASILPSGVVAPGFIRPCLVANGFAFELSSE